MGGGGEEEVARGWRQLHWTRSMEEMNYLKRFYLESPEEFQNQQVHNYIQVLRPFSGQE